MAISCVLPTTLTLVFSRTKHIFVHGDLFFNLSVPGSVLLLLTPANVRSDEVSFNIRAEAAARGIHPDRIRLDERLNRAQHVRVGHWLWASRLKRSRKGDRKSRANVSFVSVYGRLRMTDSERKL